MEDSPLSAQPAPAGQPPQSSARGGRGAAGPSSLIGKTAWSSLASIWTAAASAVTVVVVARMLGVRGAGEVAYGLWISTTAAQVALLALNHAAMRFLASPADRAGTARWIVRRAALLLLPGAALAAGVAWASGRPAGLVGATAILTMAVMLGTLGQGMLAGEQRFRRLSALSAVSAASQIVGAALGCALAGPLGGLLGQAVGQLPLAAGIRSREAAGATPAPDVVRRLTTYALETWIAMTASLVAWSRLEFVFLQTHGPEAVALYSVALTIAQLATQPISLLASALVPHFGELVGGAHTEAATETFRAVTRVFAAFSLPLCFGLAAVAPALVPLVFGSSFSGAAPAASIVAAAAAVVALGAATNALLYAHERTRFNAAVAIASGVLAAVGFALLIPPAGLIGAAVVRSFVQGLGVLAGFAYAVRRLGARAPAASVFRAAIAAAVGAGAGRILVTFAGVNWPSLFAGIAAVAVAYVGAAHWLTPLDPLDAARLAPLISRVPAPLRSTASWLIRSFAAREKSSPDSLDREVEPP